MVSVAAVSKRRMAGRSEIYPPSPLSSFYRVDSIQVKKVAWVSTLST